MRICLVSQQVAPFLHGGGIATYVAQMARSLVEAGHEAHILTEAREGLQESIPASLSGVRFHEVDLSRVPLSLPGYHMPLMRHSMGVYHALKHLHAKYRYDYIEFPDYNAEGYFSLRAKKTLGAFDDAVVGVRLHMPDYICRDYDLQANITTEIGILAHMERQAAAEADIITSPSRAMLDVTLRYGAGVMPDASSQPRFIIPNPLDVGRIQDELGGGPADAGSGGEGCRTILFYGRTQHIKGCHLLVRAAKRLMAQGMNIRVRFIGGDTMTGPYGDPLKPHLKKMAAGIFEDRFEWEENRPRHELGRAIRGASVCCFPSLMESFSMACVEAMALGAVVVGSNSGGIGEIIQDGVNGLLFEAGSDRDLERVLYTALTETGLRRAIQHEAPRRVAEYCNPGRIASAMVEAVRGVAGARALPVAGEPVAVLPSGEVAAENTAAAEAVNGHAARAGLPGGGAGTGAGAIAPVPATVLRPVGRRQRVSVIIPFYNAGKFLPQTLDSLRAQTYTDWDLVIVDDGSTEPHSLQLLDALKSQGLNIIRKPNGGPASARNVGLNAVTGEWVLALDSDDLIHPTYLERTLAVVEKDPELAVVCTPIILHTEDLSTPIGVWVPLGLDRDLLPYVNVGATAQCLLNREKVLSVGGYNEDLAVKGVEDWDLWCRLAGAGYRGSVIPEFLLTYRVRQDGVFQTQVVPNEGALKARIMKMHARIAQRPDIPMRLQLGEATCIRMHAAYLDGQLRGAQQQLAAMGAGGAPQIVVDQRVQEILRENIRYRVADGVNNALKGLRVQGAVKALTRRVARVGRMPARIAGRALPPGGMGGAGANGHAGPGGAA